MSEVAEEAGREGRWPRFRWVFVPLTRLFPASRYTPDNDYRVGDRFEGTAWAQWSWLDWLSTSFRIKGSVWGDYSGADPLLNPAQIPTADPDLRGGSEIDLAPGVNVVVPLGPLGEHRLAAEVLLPVYRDLDGPQLENDWMVVVGWQKSF